MGHHKTNQTAIDAKNGLLPPKKKPQQPRSVKDSAAIFERMIENIIPGFGWRR